jgi:hypothetical protein
MNVQTTMASVNSCVTIPRDHSHVAVSQVIVSMLINVHVMM